MRLRFLRHVEDGSKVPAVVERSRSGNGAHIWVFFDRPVLSLSRCPDGSEMFLADPNNGKEDMKLAFDSYDRLFPNQDTMPKGGFGNLIALPLQKGPHRDQGNSVFLNELFEPHANQWKSLESVQRVRETDEPIAVF